MSNLKQFRNRIKTIKSSEKITRAMQMVSASKLQKLKNQLSDSSAYLTVLSQMMRDIFSSGLLGDLSPIEQQYFNDDETKPELFIVVTSERGLCGSFNSSIIKRVKIDIANLERVGGRARLIIIGKKGYDILKGRYTGLIDSYYNISKQNGENLFLQIKERIIQLIGEAAVGRCHIYYNEFKNAISQVPIRYSILPAQRSDESAPDTVNSSVDNNFEYEGEGLILKVINLYINGVINFALLQSRASEEGARMTAMDNATKNAKEIIDKLTLKLNRSRQAIITTELIEIISGAEAAVS